MRTTVVLLGSVLLVSVAAVGALRISDLAVEIAVSEEGTLLVSETLVVDFASSHHGILRRIPVAYRRPTGERLTIAIDVRSVSMDGAPVPVSTSRSGGKLVLRIGDPDRRITGRHIYVIAYEVRRALLFHDEYVQLYWNAVGHHSDVPTDRATVRVRLPEGVDPRSISTTSYLGYEGSAARGAPATVDADGALVFAAAALAPGEGLTIDVAIPREASGLVPPSVGQRILWFLGANLYALAPLLTFAIMLLVWWRIGRDPRVGAVAPAFAPPSGMHAGEIGVLIDDRADLRDLSAMVVGLAVNGVLRIEETGPLEGARRRGPIDFTFHRVRGPDGLSPAERSLFAGIFDADHPDERTLSSMDNQFYKVLPEIKSRLYAGLIEKKLYARNPERVRSSYLSGAALVGACGVALGIFTGSLYLGAALVASGVIVALFARVMPRKTQEGTAVLREVLGLEEYIRRAEVDRIEFHNAPEKGPQLFEKLLPYAMALNLTSVWTRQFEGVFDRPPDWYVGAGPVFHGHLFTVSMLHLTSGMHRTFTSAPRTQGGGRSAWGGGARFGGGFSGGGFGGGGVSGW
ncbi:MAG: DUF2207 domain-containing protein [Candidatus Bipolaricaulota bacterium]|nr:MAG: DUF2207 domain-containing protein [Candidatus Bipolaricaulota bacterium]